MVMVQQGQLVLQWLWFLVKLLWLSVRPSALVGREGGRGGKQFNAFSWYVEQYCVVQGSSTQFLETYCPSNVGAYYQFY